jgi:hypothetical protein
MNTIHSPSILNSAANASFIPICLPKYNASGFANAYISFMLQSEPVSRAPSTASPAEGLPASSSDSSAPESELAALASSGELPAVLEDRGAAMICISGGTNFEAIKTWCDSVTEVFSRSFTLSTSAYNRDQKLHSVGIIDSLAKALKRTSTTYQVSLLGIPGLRHFLYKSRAQVQITHPQFDDPYDDLDERRR